MFGLRVDFWWDGDAEFGTDEGRFEVLVGDEFIMECVAVFF